MSRGHLLAGLFFALGMADLALLNLWLVPAVWAPSSDPIAATLSTPEPIERAPEVEAPSVHGHKGLPEPREEALVESVEETEPSKVDAVTANSANAEKLVQPDEIRSDPAGDLIAGAAGTDESPPGVSVGPDLAGTGPDQAEDVGDIFGQVEDGLLDNAMEAIDAQRSAAVGSSSIDHKLESSEGIESTAERLGEPLAEAAHPEAPNGAVVESTLASRYSAETEQPSVAPQYQILHHAVIQFSFNKDIPRSAASDILDQILRLCGEHPDAEVLVDGHTDSSGDEAYNYQLSERRALAAATVLEAEGIPAERIQVHGYGPSRPLDTRNIAWAMAKNRRVEITIRSRLP